ncbi:hypothetical protein [Paenibacillus sp. P46E]|uniref:hypothetical protein n=1 Tax=Paenibacillus sp. P46E TaxID=1349436 RepID=UPI00094050EB|nr:hypothetical protein [Paenibacillus sp. P46E]OKP97793.1 hypothetical protein A3849_13905 [Paenibacillus sp. P46E]
MRKGEKKPEGIVGTNELASIIGKTKQWISQLTRDGVLIQVSRGKYNLAETVQAYIRHVSGTVEEGKISFSDEKAQHEQIKKEMAALELQKMRSNLHTTEDVTHAWGMLMVAFRERLQGLPPRIANKLAYMDDEKEVRVTLESLIDDALTELGKYDPMEKDL